MKRVPNSEETETASLMDYALVALAQLGGTATKDQIVEHVGVVFKDQLTSADRVPVYTGPDGKQLLYHLDILVKRGKRGAARQRRRC
jgi:hypothetical protein